MRQFITITLLIVVQFCFAQDQTYLLFEWMIVDNEQFSTYLDSEDFWEKIHTERVKNGEIIGWELWSLKPGGEWQDFQFVIVQIYNDPVKMMEGSSLEKLISSAKNAYPTMSEPEIREKISQSSKTRRLALRQYTYQIATTDDNFLMPLGTVAKINLMKTEPGDGDAYVATETELFLPLHQKAVDNNHIGSWNLAVVLVPSGNNIYANYLTFDIYRNYKQMFDSPAPWEGVSLQQMEMLNKAAETRDLRKTFMGTLIKKVR